MILTDICIGTSEPIDAKSGQTGHFKRPQTGSAMIGTTGIAGDTIVDTKHHGGPDQAVYMFGDQDRVWWAETLNRDTPSGYFGENLCVSDLCTTDLTIGDVFEIGNARLQVTSPRIPCVTFAARVGDPQAIKTFYAARRPGAYLRVLKGGPVTPGTTVTHIPFDGEQVTLGEMMDAFTAKSVNPDYLRRLLKTPAHAKALSEAREALSKSCD